LDEDRMADADSPTVVLRRFQPDDSLQLAALFRAAVRGIAARHYAPEQIQAWADAIDARTFGERCARKDTWVAMIGDRVAGFSDLEPDGHIDMLYVHPDFERRGVARALLQHIEGLAHAAGMTRLYTEASITARPVFEAMGLRVLSPQTVTVRGQAMTNYRMHKSL
jgi:putative acetyltransferase